MEGNRALVGISMLVLLGWLGIASSELGQLMGLQIKLGMMTTCSGCHLA